MEKGELAGKRQQERFNRYGEKKKGGEGKN